MAPGSSVSTSADETLTPTTTTTDSPLVSTLRLPDFQAGPNSALQDLPQSEKDENEPPVAAVLRARAKHRRPEPSIGHKIQYEYLFVCLLAWRLVNAFTIRTYFQADEFYQCLEPAWAFADALVNQPLDILLWGKGVVGHFGQTIRQGDRTGAGLAIPGLVAATDGTSGAWLTWEHQHALRSSLHPIIYGVGYVIASALDPGRLLPASARDQIFLAAAKVIGATVAAVGDYYAIHLARDLFGHKSSYAQTILFLQALSPWQWFFSTRSFSNALEAALVIAGLYHWPFHWACGTDEHPFQMGTDMLRNRVLGREDELQLMLEDQYGVKKKPAGMFESQRLKIVVVLATLSILIRPTSAIIWGTLLAMTYGRGIWQSAMVWEVYSLVYLSLRYVPIVLMVSALGDRLFYGYWTFPLWNFFRFNVTHGIASFYGINQWHYYLSQGLPLLLLFAVPPFLFGTISILKDTTQFRGIMVPARVALFQMLVASMVYLSVMSLLAHKEVRFAYPLLPILHIIAGYGLARPLGYVDSMGQTADGSISKLRLYGFLGLVLLLHAPIAIYTTLFHAAGPVSVTNYLRNEFLTHPIYNDPSQPRNLTFSNFMPCHSTPWRSYFHHSPAQNETGISGWALTCTPPLNLTTEEKPSYLDESDVFYADPIRYLNTQMSPSIPPPDLSTQKNPISGVFAKQSNKGILYTSPKKNSPGLYLNEAESGELFDLVKKGEPFIYRYKRAWPDYLVFFEALRPTIGMLLGGGKSGYRECSVFENGMWSGVDDNRRKGKVVVWCLYPNPDPDGAERKRLQREEAARIEEMREKDEL